MHFVCSRSMFAVLAAGVLMVHAAVAAAAATSYEIVDLGPLASARFQGGSINNSGHVAHNALAPDGTERTYIFRDGQSEEIGSLGGGFSLARHISELREYRGQATVSNPGCKAVRVWRNMRHILIFCA